MTSLLERLLPKKTEDHFEKLALSTFKEKKGRIFYVASPDHMAFFMKQMLLYAVKENKPFYVASDSFNHLHFENLISSFNDAAGKGLQFEATLDNLEEITYFGNAVKGHGFRTFKRETNHGASFAFCGPHSIGLDGISFPNAFAYDSEMSSLYSKIYEASKKPLIILQEPIQA